VLTYPGDMAYITVQYYVRHVCTFVYVCVCLKFKISLRISQGYTNARQLYEK